MIKRELAKSQACPITPSFLSWHKLCDSHETSTKCVMSCAASLYRAVAIGTPNPELGSPMKISSPLLVATYKRTSKVILAGFASLRHGNETALQILSSNTASIAGWFKKTCPCIHL